ncbi:MAG: hypothetical protein Q7R79_03800 [bacterium]|nr:hypothetical protein [bacterium]
MAENKPLGKGMSAWHEAIKDAAQDCELQDKQKEELQFLAQRFDRPRDAGFHAVEELELPRYVRRTVKLSDFMADPETYFSAIPSTTYYAYIKSDAEAQPVFRAPMMARDQILEIIKNKIEASRYGDYSIILSENYENIYGGNIIVREDQHVDGEFKRGNQGEISTGQVTPEFIVTRQSESARFEYRFHGVNPPDDDPLKRTLYQTIREIPHDGRHYLPGYYEVHLIRKKEDEPIEPIFIDYDANLAKPRG